MTKAQDFAFLLHTEAQRHEVTCFPTTSSGGAANVDGMEGADNTSRPPSPPTRAPTPGLRIQPYPLRLQSFIPPPNFGAVEEHKIWRSAFPQDRNLDFLDRLDINTILTFVDTDPSDAYWEFINNSNIRRVKISIAPNKDGNVKTSVDSLCESLLIMLDSANYPLYIHCNQGRHRTGCVIACLRKLQKSRLQDVLAEYTAYASPKSRTGDVELITNFDPECLLEHAKAKAYFHTHPKLAHLAPETASTDDLLKALASELSLRSNASERSMESKADSGIEMADKPIDPALFAPKSLPQLSEDVEVTGTEMEGVLPS